MKRAIRVVLLLLSLWVLSGGIAEKEAVKQQALEYMKGKYGEEFVVKQRDGEDCVSEASWGYEVWMYPKKKVSEKDYPSDMECYVKWLGRDGKFHDRYYQMKLNYESWKKYKKILKESFKKDYYFYSDVRGDFDIKASFEEIESGRYPNAEISFGISIYEDVLNEKNRLKFLDGLFQLINKLQKMNKLKYSIGIGIYDEDYYKNKIIDPKNRPRYGEGLNYSVKLFEPEELLKIRKSEEIEKYIIDNRRK